MRKRIGTVVLSMIVFSLLFILCFSKLTFAADNTQDAKAVEAMIASHKLELWNFEDGTTDGWHGAGAKWGKACSINTDKSFISESAKYSLKINVKGSTDWNQDAAVNDGPFPKEFQKLVELTMDVYVPPDTMKGMEYAELYFVISGQANTWYELKAQLNQGLNNIRFKVDTANVRGEIWHTYIVVNSSQPFNGPIYVSNIKARTQGPLGEIKGKVVGMDTKQGLKAACFIIGDTLVKTDDNGNFDTNVFEDQYNRIDIIMPGYQDKTLTNVVVWSGKTTDLGDIAIPKKSEPKEEQVKVSVDAAKVIREFDPHLVYGNNAAVWDKKAGFMDPVAIDKIKKSGATLIRFPGGDFGNLYNWKSGQTYRFDGSINQNVWELNYYTFIPFMKALDPVNGEVLPILNVMTPIEQTLEQRIKFQIEWLKDMKAKGLKFRYIEIGNEPDSKSDVQAPSDMMKYVKKDKEKKPHFWTSVDAYCAAFNKAAKMIKADSELADVKIMGPVIMQPMDQERLEGEPWKAAGDPKAAFWLEKFLKLSGEYADVLVTHEYPLWANNSTVALLKKPQETWPVYMPKIKAWMKKYVPKKADTMEVALTEWNSGYENETTAQIFNGLFAADYLASYIKSGGTIACIWDMYTQKSGQGGGHGVIDEEFDPTNKYAERSSYWALYMMYNLLGKKMVKADSSSQDLSVYATTLDDGNLAIMAINKTGLSKCRATIDISGFNVGNGTADAWQFSEKEYVWSKMLFRAIINSGPSQYQINNVKNTFTADFPPYSITIIHVKK